jgi:hypothetical protein
LIFIESTRAGTQKSDARKTEQDGRAQEFHANILE